MHIAQHRQREYEAAASPAVRTVILLVVKNEELLASSHRQLCLVLRSVVVLSGRPFAKSYVATAREEGVIGGVLSIMHRRTQREQDTSLQHTNLAGKNPEDPSGRVPSDHPASSRFETSNTVPPRKLSSAYRPGSDTGRQSKQSSQHVSHAFDSCDLAAQTATIIYH
jgi:hypothetical protein